MRRIEGFTLIELVVVIAILAILAASALPKFVDLSAQARAAATEGVAGAISSAAAINFAARVAGATAVVTTSCATASVGALLATGMPPNYTVTGGTSAVQGTPITCTVSHSVAGSTASAVIISVP